MTRPAPWLAFAEVAAAALNWTPETFWSATPAEFRTAYKGWRTLNGLADADPLSRGELERLMSRFPDAPGPDAPLKRHFTRIDFLQHSVIR